MDKSNLLIVTHLPSFYKINLYNAIAKHLDIFVVFVSNGSSIRNSDFISCQPNFDFIVINQGAFELRNIISSCWQLLNVLQSRRYDNLLVNGWDLPEFWLAVFLSSKHKNSVALESTIYDCNISGIKGLIKKFFLKRICRVFASGEPHVALTKALEFTGKVIKTYGVGLLNRPIQVKPSSNNCRAITNFIYVGRLSDEKNVRFIIDKFNERNDLNLTIVGAGPQRDYLMGYANENIKFLGHVDNKKLSTLYQNHDVFILPSLREPWGLVVDEALYNKLPVLVSRYVGSSIDLVELPKTGLLFDPANINDLDGKLDLITSPDFYQKLVKNVKAFDIIEKDKRQVACYINEFSKK